MAFNNSVNAKQQGTQYLSTAGAWSGIDGGVAGQILTSNGTGVAPSFQASGASVASLSPYIVGTTGTNDFTTIQAAINAANAAGVAANIYIKPGMYVENLTVSTVTIQLIALQDSSDNAVTSLGGSLTLSGSSARCLVQGLYIQNNSDAVICTASDTLLLLVNTTIACSGTAKCINATSPGAITISLQNSYLQQIGTGDGVVINNSGATVQFRMQNSGISSTTKALSVVGASDLDSYIDGNYTLVSATTAIMGDMVLNGIVSSAFFKLRNAFCVSGSAGTNTLLSSTSAVQFDIDIADCVLTTTNATAIGFANVNGTGSSLKITNTELSFDVNKINFPEIQSIVDCTPSGSSYEVTNRHFVSADNLGLSNIRAASSLALLNTTNATAANIFTYTLSTNESVSFFAEVSAVKSDYSLQFSSTLIAGARRAGGGASLVGTPVSVPVKDVTFTGSITATVSGNDLNIQVTGIAATTIEWQCNVRFQTL